MVARFPKGVSKHSFLNLNPFKIIIDNTTCFEAHLLHSENIFISIRFILMNHNLLRDDRCFFPVFSSFFSTNLPLHYNCPAI